MIGRHIRLMEARDRGMYYLGPLEPGMRAMSADRVTVVEQPDAPDGVWTVMTSERVDNAGVAEAGVGDTEEEAWRWAIGQFCERTRRFSEDAVAELIGRYIG